MHSHYITGLFIYFLLLFFVCLFYVMFNIQGHIATGSIQVEELMQTGPSRLCSINCRPQRFKASTLTATPTSTPSQYLFIYLGFYVAFNTVQVISRRVVGRAEETSTYSSLGLCTVNCRLTASNYQLNSHLRPLRGSNPGLRGESVTSSAIVAPQYLFNNCHSFHVHC